MPEVSVKRAKMPSGIPYIVINEFAERFCFYGINAILVQHMVQILHFGDAKAATWQSMFKTAAYFFPLLGAIIADVFLAKFRTILIFSAVYIAGCAVLAFGHGSQMLILGLFMVAFGTGGIKPCASTHVGDQFSVGNQQLIERAFSYFYLAINLGSAISIYLCPALLSNPEYGPRYAFGIPGLMMLIASIVFYMGHKHFSVVPAAMQKPARALLGFLVIFTIMLCITALVFLKTNVLWGTAIMLAQIAGLIALCLKTPIKQKLPTEIQHWLETCFTGNALKIILRLCILYVFLAFFWSLWDQSNGNSWTIQAQSSLMDKHLFGFLAGVQGFQKLASYEMLPSQIQVVNGLFVVILVPIFTFGIYPLMGKFFTVTPLRKIGMGFFTVAASFLIVAWIEQRIQQGFTVSIWWQILAYAVLTAAEVLVSITALEYSYKQAPLSMKSFIMALFLLSTSVGNAFTSAVNTFMVQALPTSNISVGEKTWLSLPTVNNLVTGQKIDFEGETGITVISADQKTAPLAGTYLIAAIDVQNKRVQLMDKIYRKPIASVGTFIAASAKVSTYALVGPMYFIFFSILMTIGSIIFIFVAMWLKEEIFVRSE